MTNHATRLAEATATLLEAFAAGADIHRHVAALVNGIDPAHVTPRQRNAAKAVNFGIIYGQTAFGLSQQLGIDRREAQKFIDAYFALFATVKAYIANLVADAATCGYARTIAGRRRYVAQLASGNRNDRMHGERIAVNSTIQGSAADLIKRAMLRLERTLPAGARLVLQVHDELIVESPEPVAVQAADDAGCHDDCDGSGCDSGDWRDLTKAEIRLGFNRLLDCIRDLRMAEAERDAMRKDAEGAAGELRISVRDCLPGTLAGKLLSVNVLLRHANGDLLGRAVDAEEERDRLKAELNDGSAMLKEILLATLHLIDPEANPHDKDLWADLHCAVEEMMAKLKAERREVVVKAPSPSVHNASAEAREVVRIRDATWKKAIVAAGGEVQS